MAARGKSDSTVEFSGEKGRFILDSRWGLKLELYQDPAGTKYKEDGYMPQKDIEHMGVPYEGQQIILEQVKRSIDSGGKDNRRIILRMYSNLSLLPWGLLKVRARVNRSGCLIIGKI